MNTDNKVYLADDVIVVEVVGSQDVESVENMGSIIASLIKDLRKQGKRVMILDNITRMGDVGPEARKKVVDLSKTLDYDKAVMLGKPGFVGFGTRVMLRASGRADKIQYFGDQNKALTWLRSTK